MRSSTASCSHRLIRRCGLVTDEIAEYERIGLPVPESVGEATGCPACQHTGYRGRAPLIEVLEIDAALGEVVREGRAEEILAPTPPTETLFGHGLALVAIGRTTLSEVRRAVQAD